ncbi:MAG: helix-turn-helix domain-containing protein [Lachnospiraceae bacterium]|nr:helix-turn-helix domain-containing protein [Lachnospiraceae bacterium]
MCEEFWNRVKDLIKKSNLTQKEFSKNLGFPDRTIETWINRNTSPDVFTAQKIAIHLGVSIDYLLTGEEDNRYKDLVNKIQKDIIDSGLQLEASSQQ